MTHIRINPITQLQVQRLIESDLRCATDDFDLSRRLAHKGFGYRDTTRGRMLVTLPHGVEVMNLPAQRGC
ncbi:hypothetical protein [Pseudoprimorskyibacter insulae]|uniref:Uncharacterized protein n=1 Tax=Pseudoprimorskyibacter insulae TaxID=1695997 RepID=A0A2R8AWP3_9RHOB|nr:hypothetical protein [Pseudoprimorskyibacter insulae]SPF80461.1 hypothetical protein PRI8871_02271 [Pseudoprimorskyibacter insulae]